jgi:hypothetical membrane protein
MKHHDARLLYGPAAGILFCAGTLGLATLVPGYSHIRQTVSEIGEMTSPARIPFAILLCGIAICTFLFALALRDRSHALGHSGAAAYLIAVMGLSVTGVGLFAYPHPLHNVFGLSELIGYQAPMVLALSWKGDARVKSPIYLSWVLYLLICLAIALNLTPLSGPGILWAYLRPMHGLIQRALFGAWFSWCFIIGLVLFQQSRETEPLRC